MGSRRKPDVYTVVMIVEDPEADGELNINALTARMIGQVKEDGFKGRINVLAAQRVA